MAMCVRSDLEHEDTLTEYRIIISYYILYMYCRLTLFNFASLFLVLMFLISLII